MAINMSGDCRVCSVRSRKYRSVFRRPPVNIDNGGRWFMLSTIIAALESCIIAHMSPCGHYTRRCRQPTLRQQYTLCRLRNCVASHLETRRLLCLPSFHCEVVRQSRTVRHWPGLVRPRPDQSGRLHRNPSIIVMTRMTSSVG